MPFSTSLLVLWTMMDVELLLLSSYTFHQRLGNRCNILYLSLVLGLILSLQVVTSRWSLGLPTYLASSLEIAVLEVKTLHCSKVLNLIVKINVN